MYSCALQVLTWFPSSYNVQWIPNGCQCWTALEDGRKLSLRKVEQTMSYEPCRTVMASHHRYIQTEEAKVGLGSWGVERVFPRIYGKNNTVLKQLGEGIDAFGKNDETSPWKMEGTPAEGREVDNYNILRATQDRDKVGELASVYSWMIPMIMRKFVTHEPGRWPALVSMAKDSTHYTRCVRTCHEFELAGISGTRSDGVWIFVVNRMMIEGAAA
ncbi:hypothetical protein BDN67DRAFT_983192 [Paxillus ammoniavirescens]|nr:hypothetical protein BDN67DRAFT_983192 [Paxillus ammoniavirescens]